MALTVRYGFSSDASCVLPIATLKQFHAPFAIGCSIDSKHAKIAYVDTELFYCAAPGKIPIS